MRRTRLWLTIHPSRRSKMWMRFPVRLASIPWASAGLRGLRFTVYGDTCFNCLILETAVEAEPIEIV